MDRGSDGRYIGTSKQMGERLSDGYCVSASMMVGCIRGICGESCIPYCIQMYVRIVKEGMGIR